MSDEYLNFLRAEVERCTIDTSAIALNAKKRDEKYGIHQAYGELAGYYNQLLWIAKTLFLDLESQRRDTF